MVTCAYLCRLMAALALSLSAATVAHAEDTAPSAGKARSADGPSRLARAVPEKPVAKPAPRRTGPAEVALVRIGVSGCEPSCSEWIAIQGSIDAASVTKVKRVLSRLGPRRVPVLIDSPGGSVDEALAIGRLIRAKGLDIAVARTNIATCSRRDPVCRKERDAGIVRGLPLSEPAVCASACAFLLAGGVNRYAGARAQVGLHDIATFEVWYQVERTYSEPQDLFGFPLSERKLVGEKRVATHAVRKATSKQSYEKLRRFYAEMGVGSDKLVAIVKSTPHDRIHWLSSSELKATKLATGEIDVIDLIRGNVAPTASPSANAPPQASRSAPAVEAR